MYTGGVFKLSKCIQQRTIKEYHSASAEEKELNEKMFLFDVIDLIEPGASEKAKVKSLCFPQISVSHIFNLF